MPVTEGVEIDRVVAIVNGMLILDSDVDEERRFTELQPFRDRRNDISRERAIEIARMVLRENAIKLYGLKP